MSHQNKYLKYKKKYLDLKNQIGGCRDKILASQSKRLELKEEKELQAKELQECELKERELQARELQAKELQAKELQARELRERELQARELRERELQSDRRQVEQQVQSDRRQVEQQAQSEQRANINEDIQTAFAMTEEYIRRLEQREQNKERWNKSRENYATRFHKYTKESWITKEKNIWYDFLKSDRDELSPYDNAFLWNYETFKQVAILLQSKYKYGTFISNEEPIELNVWNLNNMNGHIEVFIFDDIEFIYKNNSSFILKIEIRNKNYRRFIDREIDYKSQTELINKIFMFINKTMESELPSY